MPCTHRRCSVRTVSVHVSQALLYPRRSRRQVPGYQPPKASKSTVTEPTETRAATGAQAPYAPSTDVVQVRTQTGTSSTTTVPGVRLGWTSSTRLTLWAQYSNSWMFCLRRKMSNHSWKPRHASSHRYRSSLIVITGRKMEHAPLSPTTEHTMHWIMP